MSVKNIKSHIIDATMPIEARIAAALREDGEFIGDLNARDLKPILSHVLYTLVAEQKIAGIDLPINHNISQMQVMMHDDGIDIFCEVHVHEPVTAFVRFSCTLENAPGSQPANLRLKDDRLDVEEVTRRFDLGARTALKMLNIPRIARRELSDPRGVILRTLPEQLAKQGFHGTIDHMEIMVKNGRLQVYAIANADTETLAS